MKTVGIVTLYHNNNNYGGVLQAYALSSVIADMGYDCKVIDYEQTPMSAGQKIRCKAADDGIRGMASSAFRIAALAGIGKLRGLGRTEAKEKIRQREAAVQLFRESSIRHTGTFRKDNIAEAVRGFDSIICGSDQIWNTGSVGYFDPVYWLDFVPEEKGKASYAACIPLTEIPEKEMERTKERLRSFDYLSVREENGKRLLEPLSDREVHIVPDPIFLPETGFWEELAGPRIIGEPYLYAYLLGSDRKQREAIKSAAAGLGLPVVFPPYLQSEYRSCDRHFGDIRPCGGPEEFLNLIRYADCVFTDSFHACAFSVLFRKQFWAFRRKAGGRYRNMDFRLEWLARRFGLASRIIPAEELREHIRNSPALSCRMQEDLLKYERENGRSFLRDALHGMERKGRNIEGQSA